MNTNPTVNRYLADKSMDRIDHALGRPVLPNTDSYRNYFATDIRSDIAAGFEASPNWELRHVFPSGMAFYGVTEAGRKALAAYLEAQEKPWRAFAITYRGQTSIEPGQSPAKARYSYFLKISDTDPDLEFADFIRESTVSTLPHPSPQEGSDG